jgi:hypothetical protein
VVARVAPGSLSDHGRLAALAARFWDYTRLPSSADLKGLWSARGNLSFGWKEILALSAGEVANGEPRARSWPLLLDDEHLADALLLGLVNLPYLLQRAELQGTSWETLMAALRFVFGCALLRLPAEVVKALVEDPWEHFDEGTPSPEARTGLVDLLVVPLIRSLREELGDVCSTDCVRVMTDPVLLEPHLADPSYWDRYILEAHSVEFDPRVLTIENDNAICKVGFDLDGEHRCPLFGERVELGEALDAYSRVLAMRVTARREDLGISGAAD